MQDFAAVGNAYYGTFPRIQGGYYPLSFVEQIHGGKGPRKEWASAELSRSHVGNSNQSSMGKVPQ